MSRCGAWRNGFKAICLAGTSEIMTCLSTGGHDIVSEFPLCFCIGHHHHCCSVGSVQPVLRSTFGCGVPFLACVLIEGKPLFGYAWLTHSPIVGRPVTLAPSLPSMLSSQTGTILLAPTKWSLGMMHKQEGPWEAKTALCPRA
jgi:hypothetical protein